MSGTLWKVYEGLKGIYNQINPSTLTGAIDVVIIQQEDGSYLSSPFHVRFGKLGVLRSREKVVDIEINGEATDLQMKLGDAGEAFFVQEVESEEEDEFPAYLATSPLPSGLHFMEEGVKELHKLSLSKAVSQGHKLVKDPRSDSSWDEQKPAVRPRRKVLKRRKKHRANIRSTSMPEALGDQEMFELEVTSNSSENEEVSSEDEEVTKHMYENPGSASCPQIKDLGSLQGTTSHRRMSSIGNNSFITPFSDPESSPIMSENSPPMQPLPVLQAPAISREKLAAMTNRTHSSLSCSFTENKLVTNPVASRPASPKSDTEVEKQHTEDAQTSVLMEGSATWQWGEFPTPAESSLAPDATSTVISIPPNSMTNPDDATGPKDIVSKGKSPEKKSNNSEGIYLDDLANLDDPEMTRIYLGSPREKEDDCESGRGASLPQSPNSVDGAIGGPPVSFTLSELRHLGPVSLSLCGGLNDPEGVSLDKFMQKIVTFDDLAQQPGITQSTDLVVKVHDKFYNWVTAAPMLLSQVVFHKELPEPTVKGLEKAHMPKKDKKKKKSSWWGWGRSADPEDAGGVALMTDGSETSVGGSASTATLTDSVPQREAGLILLGHEENGSTETDTDTSEKEASKGSMSPPCSSPPPLSSTLPCTSPLVSSPPLLSLSSHSNGSGQPSTSPKKKRVKFIKTLRLCSEQVARLNLKDGHNEVVFSVTTQYQGTTRCVSHVYLWHHSDKIIISDIDGTITKSDVIGHIMPVLGRDWSQSGVADLFTRIENNGYKMIYLSARAIGMSGVTKDMLKSIKQGNLVLPDGPMFLNPSSLFSAFTREVIIRNPEEFKISCLRDIAALFPACPFYAGFGNKFNDVVAYRALNVPHSRIFSINPKGQLRHDLSLTFLSSYSGMADIVDHFFPALDTTKMATSQEFNPVNYWRDPIPLITDDQLILINELSAAKK